VVGKDCEVLLFGLQFVRDHLSFAREKVAYELGGTDGSSRGNQPGLA
jgi:hypothetical protein